MTTDVVLEAPPAMRLHETLDDVAGVASTIREALELDLPNVRTQTLEFATHLRSLQACFARILATDVRDHPYFMDGDVGMRRLRRLRTALTATTLEHAEFLGDARVAQSARGWTLLMAAWTVLCQTQLLVDAIAPAVAAFGDDDSIDRNELRTTATGVTDTMSMAELQLALDVFRDRLACLDGVDSGLLRYLLRLELRAAEILCGVAVAADDLDVREWLSPTGDGRCNAAYIASMAWYFVALKRRLHTYLRMSAPSFYSTALSRGAGVHVPHGSVRDRPRLAAFFDRYVRSLSTEDHEQAFAKIAQPYTVGAGDLEAHSYVHGMCGLEPSTVRDVLAHRTTAEALAYSASAKFRRSIAAWWHAGERRAELTGGRLVGGGGACEAPLEQLVVLYMMNTLFVSKMHIPWAKWFVITSRAAAGNYEELVRKGIAAGLPFLVQRLGRYACVVPSLPDASRAHIERTAGIVSSSERSDDDCVLYDTTSALDACAIWVRFMHDAWDGRIHHSPSVRLRPLLALLTGAAAPEAPART
jgi:hypothetical protein